MSENGNPPAGRRPVAYKNLEFLESTEGRGIRILSEYLHPLAHFRDEKIQDTIVFFGSARVQEQGPLARYYEEARQLAKSVTEWSEGLGENSRRFVVCTGGGPGIMEAANRGASDAGGKTIGLNIGLPFEQFPNPYITPGLSFEFHYFFMRKFWLAYPARALVVFPGGFGTLDEMFELLTLMQTQKIENKVVLVLYGTEYWRKVLNFDALIEYGTISPEDVHLFHEADDPATALRILQEKLTEYYLQPEQPLPEAEATPALAKSRI
ncbi:MAG TPA: TIGR00730 family Rossman fold protein [Bryobacteraceae bacterium]|nr:TIGR00730 family Rossman fold protein [Bryobacteraceae bacterium]